MARWINKLLWLRTPHCACLFPLPQPTLSKMLHNLILSLVTHCEPFFPNYPMFQAILSLSCCLRGLIWWAIPITTPLPQYISPFLGSSVSQLKGRMLITVITCACGKHNHNSESCLLVRCKNYYQDLPFSLHPWRNFLLFSFLYLLWL